MIKVYLLCEEGGGIVHSMKYAEAIGFIELMKHTNWLHVGVEYAYEKHYFDETIGIKIQMKCIKDT